MLALACILLSLAAAPDLDAGIGTRVEVRGGVAPVDPSQPSEPAVAFVLVPAAGARLATTRSTWTAGYQLRVFMRHPNPLGINRPLLLHHGMLGHTHALGRRAVWNGRGSVVAGELDYTAATLVFGADQAATPTQRVVTYVAADGNEGPTIRLSRRQDLRLGVGAAYNGPLESTPVDPTLGFGLPTTIRAGGDAEYGVSATRRDRLALGAAGEVIDFSTGTRLATTTLYGQWARQLTRRAEGVLKGGAMLPYTLRRGPASAPVPDVVPLADAAITATAHRSGRLHIRATAGAGVEPFVDTIRATLLPQFGVRTALAFDVPPDWLIGAEASFYTAATRSPGTAPDGSPDQMQRTVITVATPVRYRMTTWSFLEFGTRFTVRAPHLRAPNFELQQPEFWAYGALIIALGTDGRSTRWLP